MLVALSCAHDPVRQKCISGDCKQGSGHLVWFTADYKGEFKDGKPHGQGQMQWPDGRRYVGQWEAGHPHGKGSIHWPDGKVYQGQIRQGQPHGYGTLTYKNGEKLEGRFEKGFFKNR